MTLSFGPPCNISVAALPASVYPPFPYTIPPSFLCQENLFPYTHGLCGSPPHPQSGVALPPSQPGGQRGLRRVPCLELRVYSGSGCWVSLSPSWRQDPRGWHTRHSGARHGVLPSRWGQGCCAAPPVSNAVHVPLLARRRMGQARRRYSCPPSD